MAARINVLALAGAALTLTVPALVLPGAAADSPPASVRIAPVVEASWEMNEPAEATTMLDSGPNGFDTPFDQAGLDSGFEYDGATGYRWPRRNPTNPPANPERVIVIPDDPRPAPMHVPCTIELRYRTKEKFGNIAQKGQARTVGGQWKIQNPGGRPSCLYKGSIRRGSVRSQVTLNDNQWHTLLCVKTPSQVELWVDGVQVGRKVGAVGTIDNKYPMTIGGKIDCDQIRVTCDYFSGEIDYVRVSRGA